MVFFDFLENLVDLQRFSPVLLDLRANRTSARTARAAEKKNGAARRISPEPGSVKWRSTAEPATSGLWTGVKHRFVGACISAQIKFPGAFGTPPPDNLRIGYDQAFDAAASSRAGGIAALLVLGAAVAVAAA